VRSEAISLKQPNAQAGLSKTPGDREADYTTADDYNVRTLGHLASGHHLDNFELVAFLKKHFIVMITPDDYKISFNDGSSINSLALEKLSNG
jgi:hypothetical protein